VVDKSPAEFQGLTVIVSDRGDSKKPGPAGTKSP
jgi:hypothetical protein